MDPPLQPRAYAGDHHARGALRARLHPPPSAARHPASAGPREAEDLALERPPRAAGQQLDRALGFRLATGRGDHQRPLLQDVDFAQRRLRGPECATRRMGHLHHLQPGLRRRHGLASSARHRGRGDPHPRRGPGAGGYRGEPAGVHRSAGGIFPAHHRWGPCHHRARGAGLLPVASGAAGGSYPFRRAQRRSGHGSRAYQRHAYPRHPRVGRARSRDEPRAGGDTRVHECQLLQALGRRPGRDDLHRTRHPATGHRGDGRQRARDRRQQDRCNLRDGRHRRARGWLRAGHGCRDARWALAHRPLRGHVPARAGPSRGGHRLRRARSEP